MKTSVTLFIAIFLSFTTSAQLGTAPDFKVIDVNGNHFHLYEELDKGKPVILACMATWSKISFDIHRQYLLEELYGKYGPEGTQQVQILLYEGAPNTTLEDLEGKAGNTLGNWIDNISYPVVNEEVLQVPLEVFAPLGFPSIRIIRPDDYEITADLTYAENLAAFEAELGSMITLFEDTGQEFDLYILASDISCYGARDGEINLTISGGYLPYQVEWADSSSVSNQQNLSPGEYAVTVADAMGNIFLENIPIREPDQLQVTNVRVTSESGDQENGSISFNVEGGTPPYHFEWNTGAETRNLRDLASGTYRVMIMDANQCELEETFVVDLQTSTVVPAQSPLLLFPNPTVDLLTVKNLGEQEVSYEILNNLGQMVMQGVVREEVIDLTSLPAGFYYILFNRKIGRTRRQLIKL
ncbi:MAG: T9SS type A sorting domain-containing protein [Bacteroidota bacterium]